ncbi:MAG: phage tail tape measure protein [Clostridiales bacterium]|nr:phage tail tape measure protein [Clostridiales bacterium]
MGTELATAYVQIVPSADGIKKQLEEILGDEVPESGQKAGKTLASSLTSALSKALAAAGISKIVSDAITSGTEWETSIAKLGTIADTSAVSIEDMSSQIASMSDELGISQSELAETAYSVISATGDTAGALDVVEQSAKLATAGFTDTESAVSVLTTAMNAYGLEADDVDHISDSLITTQNLGVTTVADLASTMGRAIATASGYNVSLENLEAAYISTTKAGISTEESTTYLSSMMSELGDAGSDVAAILQAETGESFGQLMEDGYSLGDVLGILYDNCGQDSEAFMNLWGSQEAGKAANSIVNQGLDEFNEHLEQLEGQAGTTEDAYAQMTDTLGWKTDDLKTKAENLSIQLFQDIYPVLEELIDEASEFIDSLDMDAISETISDLAAELAPVVETLGNAIGFIAEHLDVVIPLVSMLIGFSIGSKIMTLVGNVKSLISGITGISSVVSMLGGPVTIVVTLIAGVITTLVTLWNTNEDFRNAVLNIWEKIKSAFSTAVEAISGALSTAKEAFETAIEAIKNFFSGLVDGISGALESAWNFITGVLDNIVSGFQSLWNTVSSIFNTLVNALSTAWETIKNVVQVAIMFIVELITAAFDLITLPFQFIWENCKETILAAWEAIKSAVSTALDTIQNVISTVWNAIVSFLTPILEGIKSTFTTVWNAIQNVVSTVVNAVKSVIQTVFNAVKTYFTTVLNAYKTVFTTVFNAIKSVVTTVVNAIKSVITTVFNAVKGTVTSVLNAIKTTFSSVWNAIKTTVSNVVNGVKTTISNGLNAAKTTVSNVLGSIKDKFTSIFDSAKTIVKNAIDKIKGFFNFSWSLPKLKMPHFSITGSFSLSPPSVPKFSIEWYDEGGIFTSPTVIGVGEKRPEFVGALDDLRGIVRDESGVGGDELIPYMKTMVSFMEQYFPEFAKAEIKTDTGAVVGWLAKPMDSALGKLSTAKERGR